MIVLAGSYRPTSMAITYLPNIIKSMLLPTYTTLALGLTYKLALRVKGNGGKVIFVRLKFGSEKIKFYFDFN